MPHSWQPANSCPAQPQTAANSFMRHGRNQLLYSGRIRTPGIVTPSRIILYVLVSPCILFSPLLSGLVMSFVACPAVTTELIGDQSLRKKKNLIVVSTFQPFNDSCVCHCLGPYGHVVVFGHLDRCQLFCYSMILLRVVA